MKTQKQSTAGAATTSAIYDVAPSQNWSRAMPPGYTREDYKRVCKACSS